VRSNVSRSRRAIVAVFAALVASTAFSASTAAAATCSDMLYEDRVQAKGNAAGVIYYPRDNLFHVYDNVPGDGVVPGVEWNYAGVRDRWKLADDALGTSARRSDWFAFRYPGRGRRSREICFRIVKSGIPYAGTTRRYAA
jgi:hypothetical protein